jgi:hypothetical protein
MNATSTLKFDEGETKAPKKSCPTRLFHTVSAPVLMVATLIGFQQFYRHGKGVGGREISPRILPFTMERHIYEGHLRFTRSSEARAAEFVAR